ncbi:MAG: PAS domain S-box protein, partial [Candidatus Margulisbacteria bacterium]|nr:PAS domain S-box protein [Candidatus Margulisiibacteriota bacterium]
SHCAPPPHPGVYYWQMVELPDSEYQKLQARLNEASRMVTVVRDSNDAITIQDFEGKIAAWNRGAELMYGYSEQEALKKNIWDLTPPDKSAEQKDFNRRLLAGEKVSSLETQRLTKDGRLLDVWLTVTKLVDETGEVIGIASTERDITERKRIESEARNIAERYKSLFDSSSDILVQLDTSGTVVDLNPQAELISGYKREEIVGKKLNAMIGKFTKESVDLMVANFATRKEGVAVEPYEVEAIDSNGQKLYFEITTSPLKGIVGKEAGELWIMHNITRRKQAEEELNESKTLFETVVENIPLMIFLKEAKDLRFVIFNRAGEELLGYDRKDLLGKNNLDLFPPEQAANFMAKDREVLDGATGKVDIPEEPITTAKQGVRLLHTHKVCVKGEDGATKFLLGISEDITERKQMNMELKKKVTDLEEFYQLTVGREIKMIELEKEIERLKKNQKI